MEYLALFARPSHAVTAADLRLDAPGAEGRPARIAAQSIDPTPTGSISDKVGAARSINVIAAPLSANAPRPAASSFKLLYVSNGEALLQTDGGILHIKAGDTLPALGRINTIERSGERWVVSTQNGARFEWPPQPPANADAAGPRAKLNSR
jgi:hypothetical protein